MREVREAAPKCRNAIAVRVAVTHAGSPRRGALACAGSSPRAAPKWARTAPIASSCAAIISRNESASRAISSLRLRASGRAFGTP